MEKAEGLLSAKKAGAAWRRKEGKASEAQPKSKLLQKQHSITHIYDEEEQEEEKEEQATPTPAEKNGHFVLSPIGSTSPTWSSELHSSPAGRPLTVKRIDSSECDDAPIGLYDDDGGSDADESEASTDASGASTQQRLVFSNERLSISHLPNGVEYSL